jgi:hypothetical protein
VKNKRRIYIKRIKERKEIDNKQAVLGRIDRLISFYTPQTARKTMRPTVVFVAAGTCSPSRCVST